MAKPWRESGSRLDRRSANLEQQRQMKSYIDDEISTLDLGILFWEGEILAWEDEVLCDVSS
jgi:hypothetical protein